MGYPDPLDPPYIHRIPRIPRFFWPDTDLNNAQPSDTQHTYEDYLHVSVLVVVCPTPAPSPSQVETPTTTPTPTPIPIPIPTLGLDAADCPIFDWMTRRGSYYHKTYHKLIRNFRKKHNCCPKQFNKK